MEKRQTYNHFGGKSLVKNNFSYKSSLNKAQ